MPHQPSNLELEERAFAAESLLQNKLLQEALDTLREEYANILLQADVGSSAAMTAHACLKAIRDVTGRLQSIVTDYKMAQKRPRKVENG
jgi:hypothetical protein